MPWPRFSASSSSAKVESPRMLMRAMGSIWTATFNFMGESVYWLWDRSGSGAGIERRQQIAPPRHDVDLTIGGAKALCQDAIALGHQIGGGAALGGKTGAKRGDARRRGDFCRFFGRCEAVGVGITLRHARSSFPC